MINFFNRTMNYRWDSDVVLPYGWLLNPIDSSIPIQQGPEEFHTMIRKMDTTNSLLLRIIIHGIEQRGVSARFDQCRDTRA